jgi:long-chain acyl-CoA synthetase
MPEMALFKSQKTKDVEVPIGLGATLETITRQFKRREAIRFDGKVYSYQELNEQANRVAGGLASLGVQKDDRVAMMLPNIPEFVFTFFGIQKLGAVAVPFNTTYKGREITFILRDSGAKAIVCLSNYANFINEIKYDCPDLEHVIVTGQRTLVFVDPDATVNVQLVFEKAQFDSHDAAFYAVGELLVDTFRELGVSEAWYKHQGSIRAQGKRLAVILLREVENLYLVNVVTYLENMDAEPLFKVIYVPPEIKERALEPMTSIAEQSGTALSLEVLKDTLLGKLSQRFGADVEEGKLTRDELIAYEKNRALANRV